MIGLWEPGWVDTPIDVTDEMDTRLPLPEFMEWLRILAVEYAEDHGAELAQGPVYRVPGAVEVHYVWPLLRRS